MGAHEQQALEAFEAHGNIRMQGLTHAFLAEIARLTGHLEEAEEHARGGVDLLEGESGSKIVALSILARVLLHTSRAQEALAYATRAHAQLEELEIAFEGESLTRLVYAEALFGCGRVDEAKAAIVAAHVNLLERAGRITSPEAHWTFLERVPENVAIIRLAREWAGAR